MNNTNRGLFIEMLVELVKMEKRHKEERTRALFTTASNSHPDSPSLVRQRHDKERSPLVASILASQDKPFSFDHVVELDNVFYLVRHDIQWRREPIVVCEIPVTLNRHSDEDYSEITAS